MRVSLVDQPVVVSGGASGLGAAVVDRLLEQEAVPLVLDRASPRRDVAHVRVDLADTGLVPAAVEELLDGRRVRAVVTAAGIDACGRFEDVAAADSERVIAVNLLGTAAVVRAVMANMGDDGDIVTVASTLGLRVLSDATAYCASKFGVVGFTRALACELQGRQRVTLVVPGGMATSFFDGRTAQYRPGADAVLADPADVAGLVVGAIMQPAGIEVKELLVGPPGEPSWP